MLKYIKQVVCQIQTGPECNISLVCVRSRRVCEAGSCVRRARHVIQRNPPPETRGSEGDSIGYKASANICPEQCKADENISSELIQDHSDLFDFPWIYRWESVHPGRRISFQHLKWMWLHSQHYTGINRKPHISQVSARICGAFLSF